MNHPWIPILRKELDDACRINTSLLASEIKVIGFKCQQCGRCCKAEYGDNTVSIFPAEIRYIIKRTGLEWDDIAVPTPSGDRDAEGNIHTFEWVLKKNDDCIFLERCLCKIYGCRPFICKTYPFYLLDGRLKVCECEGLGCAIDSKESHMIAELLKERYIAGIRESISLLEKFRGFNPGGRGNVCVHDSEGERWVYL